VKGYKSVKTKHLKNIQASTFNIISGSETERFRNLKSKKQDKNSKNQISCPFYNLKKQFCSKNFQ
jgi:hypothetical protein